MKRSRILLISGLSSLLLSGCLSTTRSVSQPTEVPTIQPGTSSTTSPSSSSQDQPTSATPTSVDPTPTSSSTSVLPPDTSSTSEIPGHEHTFESGYHYDEEHHWHNSTCGHDVVSGYEPHSFTSVVTQPTYESQGFTTYSCTKCDYSYVGDYVSPKSHTYANEWSHDETYHWHECTDVGYAGKENGSDVDVHHFSESTIQPVYDIPGYDLHVCEDCGYSYKDNYRYSDFISLYDVNVDRAESGEVVKTFGVITKVYAQTYSGDTYWCYIVQSQDYKTGYEAGCLVFAYEDTSGFGSTFDEGDFVEIEGRPSMYNNMIQFNCTSDTVTMTKKSNPWGYGPAAYELDNSNITADPTTDEWKDWEKIGQARGVFECSLPTNSVAGQSYFRVGMPSGQNIRVYFTGNNVTEVRNKINANLGQPATIYGVLGAYCYGRTDKDDAYESAPQLRLQIYFADDIEVDPTRVGSVSVSPSSASIDINETVQLEATVLPSTAVDKSVSWSSSDPTIATVSSSGLVTALADGVVTITCTTTDGGKTATATISCGDSYDLDTLNKIDFDSVGSGSYRTNTNILNKNGVKYGSYRWSFSGDTLGMFYAHTNRLEGTPDGSSDGAFYNITPLPELKVIKINYKSSGQLKVSYGDSREYSRTSMLPVHATFSEEILELRGGSFNFFMIETQDYNLYLDSLSVYHNGVTGSPITDAVQIPAQQRIAPTRYTGSKVSGTSTVTVPTAYSVVGNTYTVTASKTYTYYSFSDVKDIYDADPSSFDPSIYALTDPTDIANYYIAFGEIPVNFGTKTGSGSGIVTSKTCGTASQVNSMFGSNYARMVQEYNWTTGYARSVPVDYEDSNWKYFEFDFAGWSGYTTSDRDVSRVVLFESGFTTYADGIPVACMTRDHYATFQEYLGAGEWGIKFNATNNTDVVRLNRYYGSVTTLQPVA